LGEAAGAPVTPAGPVGTVAGQEAAHQAELPADRLRDANPTGYHHNAAQKASIEAALRVTNDASGLERPSRRRTPPPIWQTATARNGAKVEGNRCRLMRRYGGWRRPTSDCRVRPSRSARWRPA